MIPAGMLAHAEVCGAAPLLPRTGTIADRRRDAFLSAIYAADAPLNARDGAERIRAAAFGALSPADSAEITSWFADYAEDVRRGVIPVMHSFDVVLGMDAEGKATRHPDHQSPTTVIGSADNTWCETPGEASTVAVVLMHASERGDMANPAEDLGLAFLALAWAQVMDLDRAKVGRCYHRARGEPRYVWSPILEERDLEAVWTRVQATAAGRAGSSPTVGAHCETCPVRLACAAWLGPPMQLAHDALRPFQGRGYDKLTRANAARALRVVQAMRDAVHLFEAQLRTLAREEGGIPDGHGRVWGPHLTKRGEVFEWHTGK